MFEGDTRAIDRTTYPHNYFKAALFEVEERDQRIFLHRTFFDYPEGLEPSDKTELIDIEKYSRAAHVLAYKNQEIIVVEDIPSEAKEKPKHAARWMDIRAKQHEDYKSMICAPIVHGKRGTSSREVLAVLVIDTDRESYFRENPHYRAFLGRILSVFRTLLTISLEMEIFQPLICKL